MPARAPTRLQSEIQGAAAACARNRGPRAIRETTASPPRINGVRPPPNRRQPNVTQSVTQQQMPSAATGRVSQSTFMRSTHRSGTARQGFLLSDGADGILMLYWQSCNTACTELANSSVSGAKMPTIKQHAPLHIGNVGQGPCVHTGTGNAAAAAFSGASCGTCCEANWVR